jgi:hypothetical protein
MKELEKSLFYRALTKSVMYPNQYAFTKLTSEKYPSIPRGRSRNRGLAIRILEPNTLRSVDPCGMPLSCQGPKPKDEGLSN